MINVEIDQFRDGSLALTCGDEGMETDLVFAAGAMTGNTLLERQREILEHIVASVSHYNEKIESGKTEKK